MIITIQDAKTIQKKLDSYYFKHFLFFYLHQHCDGFLFGEELDDSNNPLAAEAAKGLLK